MKQDLQNREDIIRMVDAFYARVKQNSLLSPIFTDVARLNWEQHMPVMYAFWAGLLLGEPGYSSNPMSKHLELSQKTPLKKEHFDEWLHLFRQTVDELFMGEKASEAKTRAENIAHLMLYKIENHA